METVHAIILLLSTALPLLGTTLTFISKYIKSIKAKKNLEDLTLITAAVEGFMIEAEKFKEYSGSDKKGYVISCAKCFANDNKIVFDEYAVNETIEELISFSKNVNQKLKKINTKKENENG